MKYIIVMFISTALNCLGQTIPLEKVEISDSSLEIGSLDFNKRGTWNKVYSLDFKMPKDFHKVGFIHEIIDYDQVVYQSCKSLNNRIWDEGRLTHMINRWGVDTSSCAAFKINSFINGVIARKKNDPNSYYAIDENNNFDFSDEKFYEITTSINRRHEIVFERFENSKVIEDDVIIQIIEPRFDKKKRTSGLKFRYSEVREAQYQLNSKNVKFQVKAGDYYNYHNDGEITVLIEGQESQTLAINQYFNVSEEYFRVTKLSKKASFLIIDEYMEKQKPLSNQIGFEAPALYIDNQNVLADYRGKFVYLYFWNVDCGACEIQLPKLYKRINANYDLKASNFEILLISVDKPKKHEKFLSDHRIKWKNKQIFGDDIIYDDYVIQGYPTTVILNEEGKVLENGNFLSPEKYLIEKELPK